MKDSKLQGKKSSYLMSAVFSSLLAIVIIFVVGKLLLVNSLAINLLGLAIIALTYKSVFAVIPVEMFFLTRLMSASDEFEFGYLLYEKEQWIKNGAKISKDKLKYIDMIYNVLKTVKLLLNDAASITETSVDYLNLSVPVAFNSPTGWKRTHREVSIELLLAAIEQHIAQTNTTEKDTKIDSILKSATIYADLVIGESQGKSKIFFEASQFDLRKLQDDNSKKYAQDSINQSVIMNHPITDADGNVSYLKDSNLIEIH